MTACYVIFTMRILYKIDEFQDERKLTKIYIASRARYTHIHTRMRARTNFHHEYKICLILYSIYINMNIIEICNAVYINLKKMYFALIST